MVLIIAYLSGEGLEGEELGIGAVGGVAVNCDGDRT